MCTKRWFELKENTCGADFTLYTVHMSKTIRQQGTACSWSQQAVALFRGGSVFNAQSPLKKHLSLLQAL